MSAGASAASRRGRHAWASRCRCSSRASWGFKLTGEIQPGDRHRLVLTITEMPDTAWQVRRVLRRRRRLANRVRQHEPRVRLDPCAIFPVDEETVNYLWPDRPRRPADWRRGRTPAWSGGTTASTSRASRVPRTRPRHRRPVDRGPEAPAGPHPALGVQGSPSARTCHQLGAQPEEEGLPREPPSRMSRSPPDAALH